MPWTPCRSTTCRTDARARLPDRGSRDEHERQLLRHEGATEMERGAATRGKVAAAMAGAEAIEIKATIPDRQIRQRVEALRAHREQRRGAVHLLLRHARARPAERRHHRPGPARGRRHPRQHGEVPAGESDGCRGEVAQVSRLQDRGRRERDVAGQVRVVLDARGQGADQAGRRRQEGDLGDLHRRAGGVPYSPSRAARSISPSSPSSGRCSRSAGVSRIRAARGRSPRNFGSAGTASG